ncbi:Conserved membrane protein YqhR [Amphibacillus marinus]|uniref:Conserved membrane protein YqhR n=1 Tax=Amphibacillus marinus TaxID=872970 RepID=A0A1H8NMD9_9BACI|nr:YqhR family membrane protein [Amphibacillus marinus]SEO30699.1 Conserved membrane protein YqhR [Amphibacillus marinus]
MIKQEKKKESIQSLRWRVAEAGFFGGLLWSSVGVFASYFNFTKVSPSSLTLQLFFRANWIMHWQGELLAILILSIISIVLAYLYYFFLKNLTGMMPGLLYGIGIWLAIFLGLSNWFESVPSLVTLSKDTIVTTICIFILYGVFIGYTISYDFMDYNSEQQ